MTIDDVLRPMRFPRGTEARNGLWLAPLTNLQSEPDGTLSSAEERWLLRRAEGGFGVVETCAAYVAQDGKAWPGELGIDRDACVPRLAELAAGLRSRGALGLVQLFHGGARAARAVSGLEPWSATAVTTAGAGMEPARAGSEEDLARVIDDFRAAALRAHAAGFDGIEVHGAHGYLLCQFLSAVAPARDDRWGGSLEGRARLLREVVRAIRQAVPPPFLVGVRLSPENYGAITGLDLDETAIVARDLVEDGIDFLHLSLWDHRLPSRKYPDENPYRRVRAAVPADVPMVAAGQFWTPDEVASWVGSVGGPVGSAPVALGRAAILNPEWPRLAATPGWLPRRPPMTAAELGAADVSPTFVQYLRRWKGFVADAPVL
ncbi:MAG: NADH:flavin oxidoreductase [Myxococcota bacterium]